MCPAHLGGNPDGLRCQRTDVHDPAAVGGHCYQSSSVADLHTASEDAAERRRG
jgi:hypothetical protein